MAHSADTENSSGPLAERLRARIRREGPISFCDWMRAALYDPIDGYYCRADRIRQGRAGDYRTAPESSPLFAATFARHFAKMFSELGSPSSWTVFEIGAGAGEFAHGFLNSLRAHHFEVFAATSYVIDEVSPATRRRAADRLAEFADRLTFQRLDEIDKPAAAGVLFSNELIDAFPVHRIAMRKGELRELSVGMNQTEFVWVECDLDQRVAEYCQRVELRLAEGQITEINLEAEEFVSGAAALLDRGFVVTVDYGAERDDLLRSPERREGTLRAFHRHQLVHDVLARPGEQDLTTTVDWTQLKEAGKRAGLRMVGLKQLDQFLRSEGLLEDLLKMTRETPDQVEALRLSTSAREMIMPHGLAASFQVLIQEKRANDSNRAA